MNLHLYSNKIHSEEDSFKGSDKPASNICYKYSFYACTIYWSLSCGNEATELSDWDAKFGNDEQLFGSLFIDTTIAANKYSNIWLLVGALVHSKVTETPRQRFITCITDSVGPWI